MYHRTPLPPDLAAAAGAVAVKADLADPSTIPPAVRGAEVVVHFAGRLFAPRPERFLPETNTGWFRNLLAACVDAGVSRVILISFPHVEGPTSVESPATGRLDRRPVSVHAITRLEEERHLFARTPATRTTPVVLRLGAVYGRGILMVEAARWLARRRLLAVWKEPTLFQLLSTADFLAATEAAVVNVGVSGIYHVGDEQPVTIQRFLDEACRVWRCRPPRRLPFWMIQTAAWGCETYGLLAGTGSPLTLDALKIGRVPHWGDTRRARQELIPQLLYPNLESGLPTLE